MRKAGITLLALGLTALLMGCYPRAQRREAPRPAGLTVVRVWTWNTEGEMLKWLKKQAGAYEKQQGKRVYLRAAGEDEIRAALAGEEEAGQPDLLLMRGEGNPVSRQGYALIVRDAGAALQTPMPTSALFSPPSPSPGPAPAPAPWPEGQALQGVLVPPGMAGAVPGAIAVQDPAGGMAAGSARAALLTAGQAETLSQGYRAYALAGNAGVQSTGGKALTQPGVELLAYLQSPSAQQGLKAVGLYSPFFHLYGPEDPLRMLLDQAMALAEPAA